MNRGQAGADNLGLPFGQPRKWVRIMALSATAYLSKYRSFAGIKDLFADIYTYFVTTTGTQTLTNKTLTAPTLNSAVLGALIRSSLTATPVAAAGTTVADAAQLPSTIISFITSDGATKGVKLPAVTAAGVVMLVFNNSSTAAELYAESTGAINGASADASMVIPASTGVLCISTAAKTWKVWNATALASAS